MKRLGRAGMVCLLAIAGQVVAERISTISCEWSRLGIDGGGYITSVTLDPTNPKTIYCGSDKGGVHRSDNGGESWKICTTGFNRETFYGVSAILPDAKNPGRVYCANGTGWADKFFIAGGLWRSDDRGENWTLLTKDFYFSGEGTGKFAGHLLAFDPTDHDILYAASFNKGLWKTRDAGKNWRRLGLDGHYLTGVWVDPDDCRRLLVSARQDVIGEAKKDGGLFESRDGGETWKKILAATSVLDVERHSKKLDWLAAACNDSAYVSKDRGATWEKLTLHKDCKKVIKIRWHRGKDQRLWTAGGNRGLFYTDDFGKSWNWPTEDIKKSFRYPEGWWASSRQADWTAMASVSDLQFDMADPNRLYSGDYYTVLLSIDGGKTWTQKPKGLNVVCVYQVVCDPKDPETIYVNNADIGLLRSRDGGKTFHWPITQGEFSVNETSQLWINPANNRQMILTVTFDWKKPHWTRVGLSRDAGSSWTHSGEGLPFDKGGFLTGLAVLDIAGNEIMVSYSGIGTIDANVYYSGNGGKTWQAKSEGLPNDAGLYGSSWQVLPNLAAVGDRVYTATQRGLYVCNKKEKVWQRLGKGVLPELLVTMAVNESRPECLWIGTYEGLYFSTDFGKSWQRVGPASMQRCRGIAIDPHNPKRWIVAVEQVWSGSDKNMPGVYVTQDDGSSWQRCSDMPCEGLAWRVTFDPHRRDVFYIGTNGAGVWRGHLIEAK